MSVLSLDCRAEFEPLSRLIANKRLVYFGETHLDVVAKNFMVDQMSTFKKLGFTHIALEIFEVREQKMLDDYMAGKINDDIITDYLKYEWGWCDPRFYLEIVKAAKREKLKIIALDPSRTDRDKPWPEFRNTNAFYDEKYIDTLPEIRENSIAQILINHLRHPENRIITLIGSEHINPTSVEAVEYQPQIIKNKTGVESVNFQIQSLEEMRNRESYWSADSIAYGIQYVIKKVTRPNSKVLSIEKSIAIIFDASEGSNKKHQWNFFFKEI